MGIVELFKGAPPPFFFFFSIIVNFQKPKAVNVFDLSLQKNTPITIHLELIGLNTSYINRCSYFSTCSQRELTGSKLQLAPCIPHNSLRSILLTKIYFLTSFSFCTIQFHLISFAVGFMLPEIEIKLRAILANKILIGYFLMKRIIFFFHRVANIYI